jgi:hypothetical protein
MNEFNREFFKSKFNVSSGILDFCKDFIFASVLSEIEMVAYYVKNKKCFRRHLGLSRHFDFSAWQHCFHFFIISATTYKK